MSDFQLVGLLLTILAGLAYINQRVVKLPDTIGITAIGMVLSIALMIVGELRVTPLLGKAQSFVAEFDFSDLVFNGFLGLLLFAGALHVNVRTIRRHRWTVGMLASVGVLLSTAIAGTLLYGLVVLAGIELSLWWCLAFGALISPTDPVAVLSMLRGSPLPKSMEDKITGEALFNDGVAVVLFITLVGLASGTIEDPSFSRIASLLVREVVGAVAVGGALGLGAAWLLSRVDSHAVEILITLALATAGYATADALGASSPLAVVIMGLIVGSDGFQPDASTRGRRRLFEFWSLLDELLNLLLFGLIGLLVLSLEFNAAYLAIGVATVVIVLFARFVSVGLPLGAVRQRTPSPSRWVCAKILTWSGLRGGVSIALALALPGFAGRDLVQTVTYVVVAFSLLVQATTIRHFVGRWLSNSRPVGSPRQMGADASPR
ncbi:sodium:proton antiporter [Ramlibacter monticola]|uniref:Sodium:proton antiporter n=1 Tax=Ramlibacter monticola TaxID=1926872 RepID=A0A937CUJ1_9BURK|nr:sodium:proton antiporter [Ramlibacter monticola]MBL0392087.1 sodium:proton antiporter [Ramlibacter monticola]